MEIAPPKHHVDAEILEKHGAVSEEVVRDMVKGALQAFDVDYAIATSGIAGPTGGTSEKPVGTVWIAAGMFQLMGMETQEEVDPPIKQYMNDINSIIRIPTYGC